MIKIKLDTVTINMETLNSLIDRDERFCVVPNEKASNDDLPSQFIHEYKDSTYCIFGTRGDKNV